MRLTPKRRTFLLAFAVASFLLLGPYAPPCVRVVAAQDGEAAGLATPQHAWLAREAGDWTASCRWFSPDGVVEFEGRERNRMACGDLWLVSDFEADFMGAPFTGHSILGYDPAARALKGVWVDSGSTRMMQLEGSLTEDVRVLMTRGLDPATGEEYDEKHVTRLTAPDERVFRMLRLDGTEETLLMEITYHRAAK